MLEKKERQREEATRMHSITTLSLPLYLEFVNADSFMLSYE
jgi:hypothetical protein